MLRSRVLFYDFLWKGYWKQFQFEVSAIIKGLFCQNFFKRCLLLTYTGKKFLKLHQKETEDVIELKSLYYFEKYKVLDANPIILARQFQHLVSAFFNKILLISSDLLSKFKYYAIRIEFQMRGFFQMFIVSFGLWTKLYILNQLLVFI